MLGSSQKVIAGNQEEVVSQSQAVARRDLVYLMYTVGVERRPLDRLG